MRFCSEDIGMPKLSIIILSYNTCDITLQCLDLLYKSLSENLSFSSEIVIVDNASQDDSVKKIESFIHTHKDKDVSFEFIKSDINTGFPKGNNIGVNHAHGEYILFLNSDVLVEKMNWQYILEYLDRHHEVGGYTVKVQLSDGNLDKASHRGFPTLWNAFSYYSMLEAMTRNLPPLNRYFGGYHLTSKSLDTIHEIDSPSGAFFLVRRSIFTKLHGFDETFFMYGEDIDLAYRIKREGYKIIYDPTNTVTHLKYQSGIKKKEEKTQNATKSHFYNAMKIFYKKHYSTSHTSLTNKLVYFFIDLKSKL
jgi:GT2 family glycosyltransferase